MQVERLARASKNILTAVSFNTVLSQSKTRSNATVAHAHICLQEVDPKKIFGNAFLSLD